MLRTCVLCCALAGILAVGVGCESFTKSRDEAVAGMQTDLEKLDKKIAELKEKADKAAGDEKGRLEAKWKEASAKRDAVKKKLDELKTAAVDKWDAVKKEADTAVGELKKAVE
jgi:Skp family chaperone for outer membrane proteins